MTKPAIKDIRNTIVANGTPKRLQTIPAEIGLPSPILASARSGANTSKYIDWNAPHNPQWQMQEMNAMLAAAMLAHRKKTTRTSDTKKEVAIRLKEIIHMFPDTDAAAFKPTIVVVKNRVRSEN